MTHDEIAMVVTDAIRAVLSDPELHCRYKFSPEKHEAEHEALRKFIKVMGRIDDIKWSIFQKAVVWALGALLVFAAISFAAKFEILKALASIPAVWR
jgi:hypothetical protein